MGEGVLGGFVYPGAIDNRTLQPERGDSIATSARDPACRGFAMSMSLPITEGYKCQTVLRMRVNQTYKSTNNACDFN